MIKFSDIKQVYFLGIGGLNSKKKGLQYIMTTTRIIYP